MEDIEMLQEMVDKILSEKKGKGKKKEKDAPAAVQPAAYGYSEALDFSTPLGDHNLYKSQGHVNWGPQTGVGPFVDDSSRKARSNMSSIMSAWDRLSEAVTPRSKDAWGRLEEMYEEQQEMDEKHVGFKKLSHQLAHQKGVQDPDALAAAIGRKKYGAKGMAAKAHK